ncbi:MAG: NUDIX hydrolase [Xanthobacteraceae bacterium]
MSEATERKDDPRTYPTRPYLAVSAAIFRDGKVLIVRRGRAPAKGIYTLPGGGVELGETLEQAVIREVREETSLDIEPVELVGFRQAIARDAAGRVERHFVILPFAARYISGEVSLNEELSEADWRNPSALGALKTTEGLADVVAAAAARLATLRR